MPETLDLLRLTLPNDLSYLSLAQFFIKETARNFGFSGPALDQLDTAVGEAVSNVMEHAYDAEESSSFDIICERIPSGIKIMLKEKGMPFDPARIARYDPRRSLAEETTAGLGVFLMKKMVDDLAFNNLGPDGKETVLIKFLGGGEDAQAAAAAPAGPREPAVIKEKIEFDVRGMQAHEAVEISKCAYKSHGYSFFDTHIYFPEKLVELNRTGEMVSAVAVTRAGEFMGHAALLYQYPEDRIAELTFAFVNVEYRGQGALNRLVEYLFSAPRKRPLAGIYAYAVANHVFTQKSTVKFGINDCGILLATSPSSWKFKGISDDATQRISVVLSFKYMDPPSRLTLFPPPHHREMIEKIYTYLGADHDFVAPSRGTGRVAPDDTVLTISANAAESCAEIYVDTAGPDVFQKVKKVLRQYCVDHIAAVNLFLSLEDPATAEMTSEFERLGFFFAGILPCSRIGDVLILQYLNNVDLDYRKIQAYSGMAREILEYVREHDPHAENA